MTSRFMATSVDRALFGSSNPPRYGLTAPFSSMVGVAVQRIGSDNVHIALFWQDFNIAKNIGKLFPQPSDRPVVRHRGTTSRHPAIRNDASCPPSFGICIFRRSMATIGNMGFACLKKCITMPELGFCFTGVAGCRKLFRTPVQTVFDWHDDPRPGQSVMLPLNRP